MKRLRGTLLMRVSSRIWLRSVTTLVLLSTCVAAVVPRPALAACGALDVGACVDAAEYSFY
jgi:hypothetical protein